MTVETSGTEDPQIQAAAPSGGQASDPLLDCLVALSHLHDRPASRDALSAGLPLEGGRLTPSLFGRAAARDGLSTRIVREPLERVSDPLLPVVLLMRDESACVLLAWNAARDRARVLLPESGEMPVEITRADLAERYGGCVILAKPRYEFDRRTPEIGDMPHRHWFWGTMAQSWRIYRDVLVAALLESVRPGHAHVHDERVRPGGAEPNAGDAVDALRRPAHGAGGGLRDPHDAGLFRGPRQQPHR